jgi:FkbM family methyltransferase
MRESRRLHRILKFALLSVAMVILVAAVWPQGRLAVVWASGQCHGCTFRDSIHSHTLSMELVRSAEQVGAASRVIERDPNGLELVDTPMGRYWTQAGDRFLKVMLAEEKAQLYEEGAVNVKPGDIVLDCGANIGVFTHTALKRGAGLVVAIEPAPATVECLRRNFADEIAKGRVIVVPKGVWDHPDVLELAQGGSGNSVGDSFVFGRDVPNKVKVPLVTIDSLAEELNLPRVDFIKMDIEGSEKPALRGAAGVIRRYGPRMAIAAEHLPDDAVAIPRAVANIRGDYDVRSSNCRDGFLTIAPDVLLFRAK